MEQLSARIYSPLSAAETDRQLIVDFYCPSLKLVIEVDGDTHLEDGAETADAVRTDVLEGYGIRVIRFTNHDVMGSFDGVVESIEDAIQEMMTDKASV